MISKLVSLISIGTIHVPYIIVFVFGNSNSFLFPPFHIRGCFVFLHVFCYVAMSIDIRSEEVQLLQI